MATIIVTNLNDAGAGSLRQAIIDTNASAGVADTIQFQAGLTGTLVLTTGEIVISDDVSIDGDTGTDNKADVTISGNNAGRIFNMTGGTTDVDLLSLTLANGNTAIHGGAIYANDIGTLDISDSTLSNNYAANGGGGLTAYFTDTTLTNSLVTANSAGSIGGGGLYQAGGALTVTNSTVANNTSNAGGGGIFAYFSILTLVSSTVTGNQADADGSSTIFGGGIKEGSSIINITNSVVAANTSGTGLTLNDFLGTVDTADHSVFGTAVTITTNTGSLTSVMDVGLGALGDHGGTVETRNIEADSVLINKGGTTALAADANGDDRVVAGTVDVGATEFQLVVTTASDVVDAKDGLLSLREAITLANADADADADSIIFAAGLAGKSITLGGAELALTADVIIDGDVDNDNKADITISGDGKSRIFWITGAGTDVDLLSLTLTGGNGAGGGAVSMSSAEGTLDIADSTFSGNSSTSKGGALYAGQASALTISNSTFSGNSAGTDGGAIFTEVGTTIKNATIDGNSANGTGGGLGATFSPLAVVNSTITGNHADADGLSGSSGGGFKGTAYAGSFINSVLALNTSGTGNIANDMGGTVFSATNSFFGTSVSVSNGSGFINGGGDPLLGALADNGGTVQTRGILDGSAVIDAGSNAGAAGITTDANGGERITNGTVDIGAVELQRIVVTTASDVVNAGDGLISLREAVAFANASADADTITFAAGLAGKTLTLTGGQLVLTSDITIDGDVTGDDKADLTISGNNASRIFKIEGNGTDVDVLSLTLANGHVNVSQGGGIWALGGTTLDIFDTTIQNCSTTAQLFGDGEYGGGIFSAGTLRVGNSTIANNFAYFGGGVFVSGDATFVNTTIHGNTTAVGSGGTGGGIATEAGASLDILNSTITGNSGYNGGGIALRQGSTAAVTNSVIALNNGGYGKLNIGETGANSTVTAQNSFFGTNVGIDTDLGGNINNGGDPLLGALADNGGTVQTRNILSGSALIDAGNNAAAAGLSTDANGDGRQFNGTVDIGATEFQLVVDTAADDAFGGGTLNAESADGGGLSLREAVAFANANADADTITFAAGLKGQTLVLGGTQLSLTNDVIIDGDVNGDDKADITISGNNASRIFHMTGATTDAGIRSLTLTAGLNQFGNINTGGGGAILADNIASLTVSDSTINDSETSFNGGGILSRNTSVTIFNSLLTGSQSISNGGGIGSQGGTLTVINTTVEGNTATNAGGGGIAVFDGASLNLFNSTVTGNAASTNLVLSLGGGIRCDGGSASIFNSVVAGNYTTFGADTPDDVEGAVGSSTNSFFGTTVSITTDNGGNKNNGGDPLLGELLNNGGTVLTRSPLNGSPLIGMGSNAGLPLDLFDVDGDGNTAEVLPLDGRRGIRLLSTTVDIGAVEQTDNEVITGTSVANVIKGGDGNDMLFGAQGDDTMTGDAGNDVVEGQAGGDKLNGGTGQQDRVSYSTSVTGVTVSLTTNTASGGHAAGDTIINFEHVTGSKAVDSLTGNGGNNSLIGINGADTLNGMDGNDNLNGGEGADTMDGGIGTDTLSYLGSSAGGVTVDIAANTATGGHATGDIISNFESIIGSLGHDALTGNTLVNVIRGEKGNDTIRGGAAGDSLDGGTGIDTLSYKGSGAGVTVNLAAKSASGGHAAGDTFTRFESLLGSSFDDTLTGSGGANVISGGGGKDRIEGGARVDTLTGGADADTFVLAPDASSRDTLTDFNAVDDTLEVSAALFGGGLAAGALDPNAFVLGTKALAAEDRFIYDGATGNLLYDSNGNASGGARLIAVFTNLAAIDSSDIAIV